MPGQRGLGVAGLAAARPPAPPRAPPAPPLNLRSSPRHSAGTWASPRQPLRSPGCSPAPPLGPRLPGPGARGPRRPQRPQASRAPRPQPHGRGGGYGGSSGPKRAHRRRQAAAGGRSRGAGVRPEPWRAARVGAEPESEPGSRAPGREEHGFRSRSRAGSSSVGGRRSTASPLRERGLVWYHEAWSPRVRHPPQPPPDGNHAPRAPRRGLDPPEGPELKLTPSSEWEGGCDSHELCSHQPQSLRLNAVGTAARHHDDLRVNDSPDSSTKCYYLDNLIGHDGRGRR